MTPLTVVHIENIDITKHDLFYFVRESFEDVVAFFEQDSLNSVVNATDGYARITHEVRNLSGQWGNRRVIIERRG